VNLKTYRAASIADALQQIKHDLGSDAVILHTRTFKRGGWLGFGGRTFVEVTASSNVSTVHPLARKGKAGRDAIIRPAGDFVRKAYASGKANQAAGAESKQGEAVAIADPPTSPPASAPEPRHVPGPDRGRSEGDSPCVEQGRSPLDTCEISAAATENLGGAILGSASVDVARGAPSPGNSPIQANFQDDLASIKRMVGQVLQRSSGRADPSLPDALFQQYLRLIESDVATDVADEVVAAVRDELTRDELGDESIVQRAVLRRLEHHIPVCTNAPKAGRMPDGRPLTIALVGPTGVGKTTTIAKLAATYKLRHGRKVGLVTSDTYRIAAVDQLRTYANIIGLPIQVAMTPKEMSSCCEALNDCDVILIDTAGRSQHDTGRLEDLREFLSAAEPHETHLVLSSVCSQSALLRTAERFSMVKPDHLIFTKLDEAVTFGVLVNAARSIDVQLSYVTTGQEVPDHIEPGRPERLARLVLEGGALDA